MMDVNLCEVIGFLKRQDFKMIGFTLSFEGDLALIYAGFIQYIVIFDAYEAAYTAHL
jgi:hypothetical protein